MACPNPRTISHKRTLESGIDGFVLWSRGSRRGGGGDEFGAVGVLADAQSSTTVIGWRALGLFDLALVSVVRVELAVTARHELLAIDLAVRGVLSHGAAELCLVTASRVPDVFIGLSENVLMILRHLNP